MVDWREERRKAKQRENDIRTNSEKQHKRFLAHQEALLHQMSGNSALDAHDRVVKDFLNAKSHSRWLRIKQDTPRSWRVSAGNGRGSFNVLRGGHWSYSHGGGGNSEWTTYQDWGRNHTGLYVEIGSPFPTTEILITCLAQVY